MQEIRGKSCACKEPAGLTSRVGVAMGDAHGLVPWGDWGDI